MTILFMIDPGKHSCPRQKGVNEEEHPDGESPLTWVFTWWAEHLCE